jgi:hypothetical protein
VPRGDMGAERASPTGGCHNFHRLDFGLAEVRVHVHGEVPSRGTLSAWLVVALEWIEAT